MASWAALDRRGCCWVSHGEVFKDPDTDGGAPDTHRHSASCGAFTGFSFAAALAPGERLLE